VENAMRVPIVPSIRNWAFFGRWDVATVSGLALFAFGTHLTWPVYIMAIFMTNGSCRYAKGAAVSSTLAWTTIAIGLGVGLTGLLLSPHTRARRALAIAGSCAVPLLLLSAGVATHFVGSEQDVQTAPAVDAWWIYAPAAAGVCFLVSGLGRWALAPLVLYVPAMLYSLALFERHLDALLRRV
jgi:hypothetical protein